MNSEHCIKVCNSLLRGELSAVETYRQAIDKFSNEGEVPLLVSIRRDHEASAERLTQNIIAMGGTPDTDSGAWGAFATAVQGAANLFGENSALASLKQGEEHGKRSYEDALSDDEVMPNCKSMIRDELLPRIDNHIEWVDQMSVAA